MCDRFPASHALMAESLAEFFRKNFQAHREERAYGQRRGYRMEWFTYAQVLEMAEIFAGELAQHGIAKGERVIFWAKTPHNGLRHFLDA